MRNLKKILALVLALVMSMSLVTIANASDFTDADDITYEEAADVMSTIGVIEGFEDGSFDPDGTLTREQAAKLVTYMLLGTNADRLGVEGSTFNDVAATRWSASAIEYCASLGLIDGAGDGNFYPAGQLTANAFAKILLTALGYSSEKEQMTGPSWSVNVAALAIDVGLDKGIEDLSWTDVLSREEAAQMALNAIQAPLVAYENDVTIVVGDTPVSFGSGDAYYVTTTLAKEQRISTQRLSNTNEYTVEFGERYFPNLRLVSESDEFERPSHTWVYENEEIGTYVDYNLLQETYTEDVTGETLYNLLGRTAIADYELEVYVDGVESTAIDKSDLVRNNDDDLAPTGNGVLTQVFMDHDNEVITITCINTYLAKATGDYNDRTETVNLEVYYDWNHDTDAPATTATTKRVEYIDVPAIEDIVADQYVLVNMSGKDRGDSISKFDVVKVSDVEVMTDTTITRFSQSGNNDQDEHGMFSSVTADGEKYNSSKKGYYNAEVLNLYADSQLTDATYNVYLDQYGYAIGVELYEGTMNYVFVTGYDLSSSNIAASTARASAIFLDGTMSEIRVNVSSTNKNIKNATGGYASYFNEWTNNGGADGNEQENRWYSYTERDGVYTLKPATRMFGSKFDADTTINCSNVRLDDKMAGGERAYGEDDSVYITVETNVDGDVTGLAKNTIVDVSGVYTGVQNVEIEVDKHNSNHPSSSIYTLYDSNYFIIASIVVGEAIGSNANYAYVTDVKAGAEYVEDGVYYWEFEAIMDGQVVTLTATDEYTDVFDVLERNEGSVVELRFNGDYVVRAVDVTNIYDENDLKNNIEDEDVYDVELPVSGHDCELWLKGRTLYVTDDQYDRGLTFVSDAKAVVIQKEDKKVVTSEYDSVSAALASLAEPDGEEETPGQQYEGKITAVLNSQGVAEWVVFNNDSALESNSGNRPSGDTRYYDVTVNYNTNKIAVEYDRTAAGVSATEDGVREAVAEELNVRDYLVVDWDPDGGSSKFSDGRNIKVVNSDGREQTFFVKMTSI